MTVNRNSVVMNLTQALLREIERNNDLPTAGTTISLSEAARKYDIQYRTLSNWLKRGWIATIQAPVAGGAVRLVDEREVAVLARLFKQSGARPGSHIVEKSKKPDLDMT